ncbi:MAG: ABC transporter ATP-binding protein [Clostridiaceae bacterium]|nr:ABC transporter ATP-binding protein [Clostridiaceae bacterium]
MPNVNTNLEEELPGKPKDYRKVIRGLLRYLSKEWLIFTVVFGLVILSNLMLLWGPRFSGNAIDALGIGMGTVAFELVVRNAVLMLLCYVGSAAATYIMTLLGVRASQKIIREMRQDTFDKIVELPLAYIDSHQAGDLVSRISYDLDVVNQSLTHDIVQIAAGTFMVAGSLYMMLSLSPALSAIFLLMVPVTVLFTSYRVKKTRPLFSRRSKKLGQMNGYVEEILSGQKTIRAYDKETFFSGEFDDINATSIDAYYKADYQSAFNGPSVMFISNLSLALVSLFGALLFLQGGFTLGGLSAFILYSRRFSGPINEVANLVAELQSAASAAERVFTLLEQPSEPADKADAVTLTEVRGEVEFRDVSFSYIPDVPVIKGMNLTAKPGSLTAIVGPTGASKTTIINLLMRFYDPQEGEILIDGHSTLDVSRQSLRRSFAMVLQDSWLFNGSIRENIAYGRPEAKLEDIRRAAQAAHIDEFIDAQPEGFDTQISDGAGNLSQGQKQLLTIARAMLLDTPMLILDEATSNVDSRTEIAIQDAMNRLIEGRTSFVIAHRLSTIQNADHILLVADGQIKEQGTHDDLLSRGGAYAKLYQSQFS